MTAQQVVRKTVELRVEEFTSAACEAGYTSEYMLAQAMGVNRSTLSRVLNGELRPGASFIAGALTALDDTTFDTLFAIVPITRARSKNHPGKT